MEFLQFIFGVWFLGFIVSTPYFWWKRTDRSAAPLARRLHGGAYGVVWPFFVFKLFVDRKDSEAKVGERQRLEQSILGDEPDQSGR